MRTLLSRAALLAPFAALAVQPGAVFAQDDAVVAFVDVNVVPMDREEILPGHTVIVRGGVIEAVGPTASVTVPSEAVRVDGGGRWLMPGMAEMHAHVPPQNATEEGLRELMFLYVANGVTTIRGMLGAPYQLELRERLERGDILGPTLFVGAPSLNGNSAPTPDSATALVRAHHAAGYDLLKIHPGLTRAAYDAMAATAKELGITWAGHVPAAVGLERAVASGQSTVDHMDGYLEAAVPPAAEAPGSLADLVRAVHPARFPEIARSLREAGVWSVPTVLVWENLFGQADTPEEMADRSEMRYASPDAVSAWMNQKRARVRQDTQAGVTPELAARFLQLRRGMLKALADEDAPILMGTDSPQLFMVPGFALHRELRIMQEAGLTPYQIYRTGSVNVARYAAEDLGLDGAFGAVRPGNRADLVLLEANPLEDVENLQRRAGVMVRGRWVPGSEIERRLEELADRSGATN